MLSHERIDGIETAQGFSFHKRHRDKVTDKPRKLTSTSLTALERMKQCKPQAPDASPLWYDTPIISPKLPSQSFQNVGIISFVMYDKPTLP